MTETPTYYAGIDVAKDRLNVVLRLSGGYVEATNDERGIRLVVRRLRKADVELAVLEATGGLEQPVAAALALAGVPVAIVNPRQVRDVRAKATGKLAKTDRIDAAVLAHFAEAVRPELRPWPTSTPANSRPCCSGGASSDHPLGCHRSRVPERVVFEKLVQVLVFGCAYHRIADASCSESTLRR